MLKPIMTWCPEICERIGVGEPLVAGGRTIYPVARVSAFGFRDRFLGGWLSPLALVVIEPNSVYLIPFSRDLGGLDLDEVLRQAPSLRTAVDNIRGTHRIKVL